MANLPIIKAFLERYLHIRCSDNWKLTAENINETTFTQPDVGEKLKIIAQCLDDIEQIQAVKGLNMECWFNLHFQFHQYCMAEYAKSRSVAAYARYSYSFISSNRHVHYPLICKHLSYAMSYILYEDFSFFSSDLINTLIKVEDPKKTSHLANIIKSVAAFKQDPKAALAYGFEVNLYQQHFADYKEPGQQDFNDFMNKFMANKTDLFPFCDAVLKAFRSLRGIKPKCEKEISAIPTVEAVKIEEKVTSSSCSMLTVLQAAPVVEKTPPSKPTTTSPIPIPKMTSNAVSTEKLRSPSLSIWDAFKPGSPDSAPSPTNFRTLEIFLT